MKAGWLTAALLLAGSGTASASFINGSRLHEYELLFRRSQSGETLFGNDVALAASYIAYIQGVYDVADGEYFCVGGTNGPATGPQVLAIVSKYLDANPEQWSQPAARLIVRAMAPTYPCANKPGSTFEIPDR